MTSTEAVTDEAKTCFDLLAELFARDIDPNLIRRGLARTPTERIVWLEEMQDFAEQARLARERSKTKE